MGAEDLQCVVRRFPDLRTSRLFDKGLYPDTGGYRVGQCPPNCGRLRLSARRGMRNRTKSRFTEGPSLEHGWKAG